MASIRVEFVPIKKFGLGWFGLDHLQLVYQPDDLTTQDNWFVLEGDSESSDQGASAFNSSLQPDLY